MKHSLTLLMGSIFALSVVVSHATTKIITEQTPTTSEWIVKTCPDKRHKHKPCWPILCEFSLVNNKLFCIPAVVKRLREDE